jgi:hypothetical protein
MSTSGPPPQAKPTHPRPLSVTLIALGVLTIASVNLLQFWNAVKQWDFLVGLLPISPLYLIVSGLVWGLSGLVLFYGLWRGLRWAPVLLLITAILYTLAYWLDRLLLAATGLGDNWLFTGIVYLLLLSLVLWVMTRRRAKAFFGVTHDHESEN